MNKYKIELKHSIEETYEVVIEADSEDAARLKAETEALDLVSDENLTESQGIDFEIKSIEEV